MGNRKQLGGKWYDYITPTTGGGGGGGDGGNGIYIISAVILLIFIGAIGYGIYVNVKPVTSPNSNKPKSTKQ